MANNKRFNTTVLVNEDIAAAATVKTVDDAASVTMKRARGPVGRQVVKDCSRKPPLGRVIVGREAADKINGTLREGRLGIGRWDKRVADVGDCEVAAFDVLNERERLDDGSDAGRFGS